MQTSPRLSSGHGAGPGPGRDMAGEPAPEVLRLLQQGLRLLRQHRLLEAEIHYRQALAREPGCFEALHMMAVLRLVQENLPASLDFVASAVAQGVTAPQKLAGLVPTLARLGDELQAIGRYSESAISYEMLLAIAPASPAAMAALGVALRNSGRPQEALAVTDRRIEDAAGDAQAAAEALGFRGDLLQDLGRYQDAAKSYAEALELCPDAPALHQHYAETLHILGREDAALAQFDEALACETGDKVRIRAARGLVLLSLGRLREGFADCGDGSGEAAPIASKLPRWDGASVDGTLLVRSGGASLGEQVLYASLIPELALKADELVVEIAPHLARLFERSFPEVRVVSCDASPSAGAAAEQDFATAGRFLRRSLDDFPVRDGGYLVPDPERLADLRARLGDGRPVIGVCWQGQDAAGPAASGPALTDFAPLLASIEGRFVSLLGGETAVDREALMADHDLAVEQIADIDLADDIEGLAALIAACDVVVTGDGAVAHLAGALGRPAVVFLSYGPAGWYWFRDRMDSPWYPTVQLRRQSAGQPWAALVAMAAQEEFDG